MSHLTLSRSRTFLLGLSVIFAIVDRNFAMFYFSVWDQYLIWLSHHSLSGTILMDFDYRVKWNFSLRFSGPINSWKAAERENYSIMQNGLQQRKMASFLRDLEIEVDLLDKNRDKQGVLWRRKRNRGSDGSEHLLMIEKAASGSFGSLWRLEPPRVTVVPTIWKTLTSPKVADTGMGLPNLRMTQMLMAY